MKANELMIGDIVQINCFDKSTITIKVTTITNVEITGVTEDGHSHWCGIKNVQPISLSTEILEKNGWSYNDEDAKFAPETWSGGGLTLQGHEDSGFMIMATSDYDDEDTNHTPFILNYVHELQHALKLRRLSKEITIN